MFTLRLSYVAFESIAGCQTGDSMLKATFLLCSQAVHIAYRYGGGGVVVWSGLLRHPMSHLGCEELE